MIQQAGTSRDKTLVLFNFDWDAIEFGKLASQWPQLHAGFDLFTFPSNLRLAWFDMERFCSLTALKARSTGATAVVSNHEQFGALCAALLAEKMGWPGTPVKAVLACQHKLYARQVLQRIAPEANVPFQRLQARYGGDIPEGLAYPTFAKPVKAAFSVLARQVNDHQDLVRHTRFSNWELWVIRHLVEPFEKIIRKRLPEAGTAHSLMLEKPQRGRQYCLDGYFYKGHYQRLGVVDAIMYPGTDAFMRFDYPSRLPEAVRLQAEQVALKFMREIGFDHGLFNMEFIHDEQTGQVKVIEFNPRMAAQFADLYARVDGLNLHAIALALAHGVNPAEIPRDAATAGCASSFVYRSFDPTAAIAMPTPAQAQQFARHFPNALLFQYPKLPGQIERDFKWLNSYRYGIMHLGGDDPAALKRRCEQASTILGWTAPYIEDCTRLAGLCEQGRDWPVNIRTEGATG